MYNYHDTFHDKAMTILPPLFPVVSPPSVVLDSQTRGLKSAMVEADDFSAG